MRAPRRVPFSPSAAAAAVFVRSCPSSSFSSSSFSSCFICTREPWSQPVGLPFPLCACCCCSCCCCGSPSVLCTPLFPVCVARVGRRGPGGGWLLLLVVVVVVMVGARSAAAPPAVLLLVWPSVSGSPRVWWLCCDERPLALRVRCLGLLPAPIRICVMLRCEELLAPSPPPPSPSSSRLLLDVLVVVVVVVVVVRLLPVPDL